MPGGKFGTPIYGAYHSFSQNPKVKRGVMATITVPVDILHVARKFSKTFFLWEELWRRANYKSAFYEFICPAKKFL